VSPYRYSLKHAGRFHFAAYYSSTEVCLLIWNFSDQRRYTPSQADVHVFKALSQDLGYPNVARWYHHIKSYQAEFSSLPGSSSAGQAFTGETSAPAPAAAADAADDDDDEVDLFGDDDEDDAEAERLKAERVAAYNQKKANKPKTIAKVRSCVRCVLSHFYLFIRCVTVRCHS
jgi:Eukaryotic elongation factor 1 beta central acidic region